MSRKRSEDYEKTIYPSDAYGISAFTVEVPEGLDEAIYRQGYQAALADAANDPPTVTENYFAEGTPQSDSWAAGYGAAVPPLP